MNPKNLICTECNYPLKKKGKRLLCSICGTRRGSLKDNYLDLLESDSYYWGEVSPKVMRKVLFRARRVGWEEAIKELIHEQEEMGEYLLDYGRIDWLFHCLNLNRNRNNNCLDIGSGWGSLSFSLVKYYKNVYSLESVKERVEFQAIRKKQVKADNLCIVRGDFLNLPFRKSFFDLIVVNGVLEWVGLGDYNDNPRNLQIKFLKQIYKILKPGGCVYIGIENRFGLHYWLGAKDHSGLAFTSLLPRSLSNIVMRRFRKTEGKYKTEMRMEDDWNDYRTYTYSLTGYRKLLYESGFKNIDIYWTLFYSNPKFSGPIDGENFKFFLKYIVSNTGGWVGSVGGFLANFGKYLPSRVLKVALTIFSPSFLIYAYKGRRGKTFEDKILQKGKYHSTFLKVGGSSGLESKVSYFLLNRDSLTKIIKFPRFSVGNASLKKEESIAVKFGNIKEPLKTHVDNIPIFIEDPIEAHPVNPSNSTENMMVINWLLNFQKKTKRSGNLYDLISMEIYKLRKFLNKLPLDRRVKEKVQVEISLFLNKLKQTDLPITAEHGDFCFSNILVNKENEVFVLDWEDYSRLGNPIADFVFYVLHTSLARDGCVSDLARNFRGKESISPVLKKMIEQFSDHYAIDQDMITLAVPYVALRYLYRFSDDQRKHLGHRRLFLELLKEWDYAKVENTK